MQTNTWTICNSISSKKAMTALSQAGSPLFLMHVHFSSCMFTVSDMCNHCVFLVQT